LLVKSITFATRGLTERRDGRSEIEGVAMCVLINKFAALVRRSFSVGGLPETLTEKTAFAKAPAVEVKPKANRKPFPACGGI